MAETEVTNVQSTTTFPDGKRFLGGGSYGKVYADIYTNKHGKQFQAAFKECSPAGRKPEIEEVFEQETKTLQKLDHLFVIKIFDVIEMDSKKWMVMELCEGTIKQYITGHLDRIAKDSLNERDLIGQICIGLAYLHDNNIIHKDLKPENILLWCSPTNPRLVLAKLADFGFAQELKPNQIDFSHTRYPGTKRYMAPELIKAKDGEWPASFASDVYSLGVTVGWIALKGEHPFYADILVKTDYIMMEGLTPTNLHNLSWDLQNLILHLTNSDAEKRPKTSLILCHPYFISGTEEPLSRFVKKFLEYIWSVHIYGELAPIRWKFFETRNFQTWFESLGSANDGNLGDFQDVLAKYKEMFEQDFTGPTKQVYEKQMKETILQNYGGDFKAITHQFTRVTFFYDLLEAIKLERSDKPVSLLYLWTQLVDCVRKHEHQIQNYRRYEVIMLSSTGAVDEEPARNRWEFGITELEWSAVFCNEEQELLDERWKAKYQIDQDGVRRGKYSLHEILTDAFRFNVSEKWWVKLLDEVEDYSALLIEAVSSHVSNAPRVIEILLERNKISKRRTYPKPRDQFGRTPLHLAAFNNGKYAVDIIKVLLTESKDTCNAIDHWGFTPLHYAADNISELTVEITKLLLQAGASPNVQSLENKWSPLHVAAKVGVKHAPEIMEELLRHGGACDQVDRQYFEPIHHAALNWNGAGSSRLLDLLIEKRGVDVPGGNVGETPLHLAVKNKGITRHEIVKKLLEKGADPNRPDLDLNTPLIKACNPFHAVSLDVVSLLLEYGGNPNVIGKYRSTALHYAVTVEHEEAYEILKLLLRKGGDPNIQERQSKSPLHQVFDNKAKDVTRLVQLLLENGTDFSAVDDRGSSPLHYAAKLSHPSSLEIAKLLLRVGASPNVYNRGHASPLHYAAKSNNDSACEVLEELLNHGGECDRVDRHGYEPIHYAALNWNGARCSQVLALLIDKRGDMTASGPDQEVPIHLAVKNKGHSRLDLVRTLLGKGSDPNSRNANMCTPLHLACNSFPVASKDVVSVLLNGGANPNAMDKDGQTPLHFAVKIREEGVVEIVKLLLDSGADPNIQNKTGLSPLHLATSNGGNYFLDIVKLLLEKGANHKLTDQNGFSPLYHALRNMVDKTQTITKTILEKEFTGTLLNDLVKSKEFEKLLRDKGGLEKDSKSYGIELIHLAFMHWEESEMTRLLIDFLTDKLDVNVVSAHEGQVPLHFAVVNCKKYRFKWLRVLLEKGADPNFRDSQLRTPLHLACDLSVGAPLDVISLLLEYKSDPNLKDTYGCTPLHLLLGYVEEGTNEIMKVLLENGGDPNMRNMLGQTCLHMVIHDHRNKYSIDLVKTLVENGGDCDAVSDKGFSALHYAVRNKSYWALSITKLLLSTGASPNIRDQHKGASPLHHLSKSKGDHGPEIFEELLHFGGDCEQLDESNYEPIHWVVQYCRKAWGTKILDRLIDKRGVNVIGGERKQMPIHLAVMNKEKTNLEILQKLLERGADPNSRDGFGWTPLHYACDPSYSKLSVYVVALLLENGGDPNASNDERQTPYDFAIENSNQEGADQILEVLQSKGANVFNNEDEVESLSQKSIESSSDEDYF